MTELRNFLLRYSILLVLGLAFEIFYIILTPITVYIVYFLLSLSGKAVLVAPNFIDFAQFRIAIIPACVAGAAYYLLLILNLSTPMETEKRIKSLAFLWGVFLLFNVLRIVFFVGLLTLGYSYFDAAHSIVWYGGSTLFVVALWFATVKIFKIKKIPFYSDLAKLTRDIKNA